ncbi:hypothetical protein IC582_023901 [Cucumis melo]
MELSGFLGFIKYYQRLVANYGTVSSLLTRLTKKNKLQWSEKAMIAFENLKKAMVTLLVLAIPDFNRPFEIEIDASGLQLGAMLSQNKKLIASFSKKPLVAA